MYVFLQVNTTCMKSVSWCDKASRAGSELTKNSEFSISESKTIISSLKFELMSKWDI